MVAQLELGNSVELKVASIHLLFQRRVLTCCFQESPSMLNDNLLL